MKRYINALLLSISLMLGGCSIGNNLVQSNSALATLAIKAATVELINKDPLKAKVVAGHIVTIASEVSKLIDSGSIALISDVDAKIRERVYALNLSPEKLILVDSLLTVVNAEVKTRIKNRVLSGDTVVVLTEVLKIVTTTAGMYD